MSTAPLPIVISGMHPWYSAMSCNRKGHQPCSSPSFTVPHFLCHCRVYSHNTWWNVFFTECQTQLFLRTHMQHCTIHCTRFTLTGLHFTVFPIYSYHDTL